MFLYIMMFYTGEKEDGEKEDEKKQLLVRR